MKIKLVHIVMTFAAAGLLLASGIVAAQRSGESSEGNKTIIGPRNHFLAEGADALTGGDAERGVALTEKGLAIAQGAFEEKAALSNLCAGYMMLGKLQKALDACDRVVAIDPDFWRAYNNRALVLIELGRFEESEADIARGQALRPTSKKLKLTRGRLLDATDPVEPTVEIDDRRDASRGSSDGDGV